MPIVTLFVISLQFAADRENPLMKFRNWVALLSACLVMGMASPASAVDALVKKSGGRITGKFTGGSKTELTIKPQVGDPVNVPANDLASIEWDDASPELKLGLSDENNGKYDSAIQHITKSKAETKSDSPLLKAEFEFLLARVTARISLADATKRDEAIKLLQGFTKGNADHFRFYEATNFLGQVQLAKGDFAGARTTFEGLAQSPWNDYKLGAKVAIGRILMGENKADEAVKAFDEAAASAGTTPAEVARRYEALLGKARAQIAKSQHNEALAVLDDITQNGPAEDSAIQAEAYVLQGNALQALNRAKEAVLAYLHVDILFPREAGQHAEALYHMSRLWKAVQLPERGVEAEAKLQSSYPNSEWTKKLSTVP